MGCGGRANPRTCVCDRLFAEACRFCNLYCVFQYGFEITNRHCSSTTRSVREREHVLSIFDSICFLFLFMFLNVRIPIKTLIGRPVMGAPAGPLGRAGGAGGAPARGGGAFSGACAPRAARARGRGPLARTAYSRS